MTQEQKDLLLKDLCARLPYGVKVKLSDNPNIFDLEYRIKFAIMYGDSDKLEDILDITNIKPYLFPMSSMTDEDYAIYSKIWEDAGKTAYLEGCHHLISTIKAYKAANDYLLSKHYDINGLFPKGLAIDATGLNIY